MARITLDNNSGHVMILEYRKHMNGKNVYRNLPSARDTRTLLLHRSLVTPNQQLKQSFQTFAALPADETRHLTSLTQPVLKDDLSDGSDSSGLIAKELFKSLIFLVVSLDDAVIDSWRQATRHGRIDFAEVCCTSDSLLTGAMTSHGGRAVQYSHWRNRSHHKSWHRNLKGDLFEKRPRVVWMTLLCTKPRTQQSRSIS